ncbi:MAG: hydroxyphenylacetyl-CoA thioesterase PaaI [Micromonosporaceae bacterium]
MTSTHAESRRRAEAFYARDRTCQALCIQLATVAPGRASMHMDVTEAMVNGHGIAHGGYLFLLADAAFAYASNTSGRAVAQSAHITFLRPAAVGERLVAEAAERTRVGRTGIYDVTIRQSNGAIVAEFRGQSMLLASEQSP